MALPLSLQEIQTWTRDSISFLYGHFCTIIDQFLCGSVILYGSPGCTIIRGSKNISQLNTIIRSFSQIKHAKEQMFWRELLRELPTIERSMLSRIWNIIRIKQEEKVSNHGDLVIKSWICRGFNIQWHYALEINREWLLVYTYGYTLW